MQQAILFCDTNNNSNMLRINTRVLDLATHLVPPVILLDSNSSAQNQCST